VVCGEDHIVQDRAELLSIDPEQDLALGDAGLYIEVVAMQGDTTVAVGRPRKERMGEFLREHFLGIAPALGGPQDLDRDGWQALIGEQPLMGGRIIEQIPRSSRRNPLPVKRINRSLLMGHKYPAGALV